jgi:hypothetical protein
MTEVEVGLGRFPKEEIGPGRRWAQGLFPREMRLRRRWACGGDDLAPRRR